MKVAHYKFEDRLLFSDQAAKDHPHSSYETSPLTDLKKAKAELLETIKAWSVSPKSYRTRLHLQLSRIEILDKGFYEKLDRLIQEVGMIERIDFDSLLFAAQSLSLVPIPATVWFFGRTFRLDWNRENTQVRMH